MSFVCPHFRDGLLCKRLSTNNFRQNWPLRGRLTLQESSSIVQHVLRRLSCRWESTHSMPGNWCLAGSRRNILWGFLRERPHVTRTCFQGPCWAGALRAVVVLGGVGRSCGARVVRRGNQCGLPTRIFLFPVGIWKRWDQSNRNL